MSKGSQILLLVCAVAAGTRLVGLGGYGLLGEEARYAEIAREMLATGDGVLPRLGGVLYFEKPPGLAWCGALALESGLPAEWALRLVPALTGLAACAALAALARRIGGTKLAAASALAFLTMPLPLGFARTFATDGPFADALTIAIVLVALESLERRAHPIALCAAGVALAFAALARSPLVAAGIFLPASLLAGADRSLGKTAARVAIPLVVGALLAAPWFVAAVLREPAFAREYFVVHHFGRIDAIEEAKDLHREPAWFLLPVLAWGQGCAALAGLFALARSGLRAARAPRDRWGWAPAALGLLVFVEFSLLAGKRIPYVLPAFPWLALALAQLFVEAEGAGRLSRALAACLAPAALLGFALAAGAVAVLAGAAAAEPFSPLALAACAAALAGGFGAAAWLLARGRALAAGGVAACALAAVAALAVGSIARVEEAGEIRLRAPGFARDLDVSRLSLDLLARRAAASAPPSARVVHHERYFHALDFRAKRPTELFGSPGELAFGIALGGRDPAVAGRFHRARDLAVALAGPERVVGLGFVQDLFEARPLPNPNEAVRAKAPYDATPVYALDVRGRYVVFSNRPGPP